MGNNFVNTVSNKSVSFSNLVTTPLYSGILIEGSKIAKSVWEKRLMIFIAEKNQNVIGSGIVGIELTELEWDKSNFKSQRDFLLEIVQQSRINKTYNKYIFTLQEKIGEMKLLEIEDLIASLKIEEIKESKFKYYIEPPKSKFDLCDKHKVYINYLSEERKDNCLICSNEI